MRIISIFLFIIGMTVICSSGLSAKEKRSIVPADLLKMSFEEMLNIKISTAGKKEERIAEIPASAVIITREDIERFGYMSLEEILENVPGMYAIEHPAYNKTYGVRGYYAGAPRNIIFMVNGVSQTDGVFDYNIMSNFQIPVEAIDKIEVVRGPMSVIYGQGAFFGAINIITNDSFDETSLASFSVGDGMKKASTIVTGNQNDLEFSFSAGFSDSDGPDYALSKIVSDMSTLSMWGIGETNNTTKDKLERNSKNFLFSGKYKDFFADMSFNQSVDEVFTFRPSVGSGSPYDRKMAKISFGYENQITDKVKVNGKVTYHNFTFDLGWDITSSSFDGNNAGETEGGSDVYEFEVNTFVNMTDQLDITAGLYYKTSTDTTFSADVPVLNSSYNDKTSDNIDLWATFFQCNYTPLEKLRLVAGLRMEQLLEYNIISDNNPGDAAYYRIEDSYSEDNIEFIPNVAAIYLFNDQNILKMLYGQAIARPSFFQNRDQLQDDYYPDLKTEEIQTLELNYITVPNPKATINFSLFHNIIDKLIVRTIDTQGDTLTAYSTNGGKLTTNGAECSVMLKPFEKFSTEISLTYQVTDDHRDGFADIEVAYSPHLLGYAKMAYAFTEDITFALTGTYVDDMETEWDIRLNQYTGGRIGKSVDQHFLLGANLRVNDIFDQGYFLNIRGSNIFDKEFYYPTYVNNTWADKGTLGEPMQFLITIGKKF